MKSAGVRAIPKLMTESLGTTQDRRSDEGTCHVIVGCVTTAINCITIQLFISTPRSAEDTKKKLINVGVRY